MAAWRCPKCNAAIKVDADWCGQCYADLRPAPPPPPPPVARMRPPTVPATAAAADDADPAGDPLFAPRAAAPAPASPLWTDETPRPPTGWPCTECGALNDFELSACAECGMPFGAALREPRPNLPGDRRTRVLVAIAVVVVFMALVALLSMGGTTTSDGDGLPDAVPVEEAPAG